MNDPLEFRIRELEAHVAELIKRVLALEKSPKKPRSTILSPNWRPRREDLEWAKDYPHVDITEETAKFQDYWASTGAVKVDWNATFRNWIRRAAREYVAARPYPLHSRRPEGRAPSIAAANRDRINSALDQYDSVRRETD